jgi:hypothetical protein
MRIHPDVLTKVNLPARGAVIALGIVAAGCDPVINIGGANFPGWLLCAIVGLILAALLRQLFVVTGIEPYMGPAILIYPCLMALIGCVTWMIFFNRV